MNRFGSAIDAAKSILSLEDKNIKIIYMSPRGRVLNYSLSKSISLDDSNYIIICGHYEGIDERIIEEENIIEISIGDYVLTGGELAAQVLMDSVIRLIPDTINSKSLLEESHTNKLLEYPQYTKPVIYKGKQVPEILLSGHHKNISEYRKKEAIRITKKYRPELIDQYIQKDNLNNNT
ncbi:MAG: tRNA (guanosine(37)-N1)-methyltransferase TrmD [Clostridia bacterium]